MLLYFFDFRKVFFEGASKSSTAFFTVQHPHCSSLHSLSTVTLSQILFLSLGYYLGLSILTVVLCLLCLNVTSFPDPISVPGQRPGTQHPHSCSPPCQERTDTLNHYDIILVQCCGSGSGRIRNFKQHPYPEKHSGSGQLWIRNEKQLFPRSFFCL